MHKFRVLVKQLYKQKIRSKSFILMTLFYIGISSVVVFWQTISELFTSDEVQSYAVINNTETDVMTAFENTVRERWEIVNVLPAQELKGGDYDAAITLTEQDEQLSATITSYNPLALTEQQRLMQVSEAAGQLYAIGQLNLDEEQATRLLDSAPVVTLKTINDAATGGKTTDEKAAGIVVSYILGFLIYFFITSYLSMITTEVASEKGSRALEMLLVSVKPEVHFRAKLFGVILVAMTQFLLLALVVVGLLYFVNGGEQWGRVATVLSNLSPSYLLYVVLFLFGSTFLYVIVGALFGSLVSKVEEAGQVMLPAMLVSMAGFYVLISGMVNPDTLYIKVFSYIPFTAGMVMPLRIGATDLAPIEPAISLALLLLTIAIFYKLSVAFYKRSVLTYSTGGVVQKIKTVFKVTT